MKNQINFQLINDYMEERGLSKTCFCSMCKISVSTLNRILTGKNFNSVALFRIARLLNVPIYKLFSVD